MKNKIRKGLPPFLLMGLFVGVCALLFYIFYFEAKKNAIQKLNPRKIVYKAYRFL